MAHDYSQVTNSKVVRRQRRRRRIRTRVKGTAARPRLSVFRSNRHLFVQLVNDETGQTLAARGEAGLAVSADDQQGRTAGVARAFALGRQLAERARASGITAVVFDRGGYAYHGQVKAVADGARVGGLKL